MSCTCPFCDAQAAFDDPEGLESWEIDGAWLDACEARDEIDNPTETYTDWAA